MDHAPDFTCPICNSRATQKDETSLVCQSGHVTTLARYYWQKKGVGALMRRELRCPKCNLFFAEGDYSDRPQLFKCRSCKEITVFLRLCPDANSKAQ